MEKSGSPHDDFSKKTKKVGFFFWFSKIICSVYRRLLNIWLVFSYDLFVHFVGDFSLLEF